MTIFRFSLVAGMFFLAGCDSERAQRDAARIEELEQQVSSLQSQRAVKNLENSTFGQFPKTDPKWDPQGDLNREAERTSAELERLRLEDENRRLRGEQEQREIHEMFSK